MSQDPELRAHQEWLGYLQPVGLVVSPAALRDAQAHVNRNIVAEQSILIQHVLRDSAESARRGDEPEPLLKDFPAFARDFWQWEPADLAGGPGGPELPPSLEVPLPDYGETLAPTYAVPDAANAGAWLMLIEVRADDAALDDAPAENKHDKWWQASPQARFERLLRANQVPIGLLVTPRVIRLVYAPRGESTGHLSFPFKAMCEVAGRPIAAALHLLLEAGRLFSLPTNQRLPWILQQSRKYQNDVSTKLAGQVLRALNELMRGFQSANEATQGELLRHVLECAPKEVYGGLLTTLLRMVFILYAEDRGLLSNDPVYVRSYSLSGLFERLREDDAQYPDTMDQRFGAWAQFLTLCRVIYDGGGHGGMDLPARHGSLFDPDAYAFLEGRPFRSKRSAEDSVTPPRIADGVMFRVLHDLLMLDSDRLSYRSLDVEQIGSVYEAMMGFEVRTAGGTSVGLRPHHVVVNLSELLGKSAAERVKFLKEDAGCNFKNKALEHLGSARTIEELIAALGRRVSHLYLDQRGMPLLVATGCMYLQPTEERRRSGSHYTPRSLTEPIVRMALEPILEQLGEMPRPEQILNLKVCDPTMGSGAFLVEACRFLAEALTEAWAVHGETPIIPPDQEPVLHARRLIAQRCLYGVDKNPFAVDLAKLSMWLVTLAKDHPFTFLDHSLRSGDSLVGLTRLEIAAFNWLPAGQQSFLEQELRKRIERVSEFRQRILTARDEVPYEQLHKQLDRAEDAVFPMRQAGDIVIAAFFSADKPRQRQEKRAELQSHVEAAFRQPGQSEHEEPIDAAIRSLKDRRLDPFHWGLEFPEVFGSRSGKSPTDGFDAIVGNPPFMGGSKLSTAAGNRFKSWLSTLHSGSHGKSDFIAHFFRRAFGLLRSEGTFGLIATNTIRQGDTRETGLHWIRSNGGVIYRAETRKPWPGAAAVIVSIVHVIKSQDWPQQATLNGRPVDRITAYLFHMGPDGSTSSLRANHRLVHSGTNINGKGFVLSPELRDRFISQCPGCSDRIRPYLGAEEMNETPDAAHTRYAIYMEGLDEEEVKQYPALYSHLYETVRLQRLGSNELRLRERWWRYSRPAQELYLACAGMTRILASGRAGTHLCFVFQPTSTIFSDALTCFIYDRYYGFATLQSRVHEVWARFFGSSLKDDPRYIPEDCFETFPLPRRYEVNTDLETTGQAFYEHRAAVMLRNNEGLTKTYNRFHNPDESDPAIVRLRELQHFMDRAVLDSYDWHEIRPVCGFFPEFDDDLEDYDDSRPRRKKYRYRWTDDIRDDVLARLLVLNRDRGVEERSAGTSTTKDAKPKRRGPKAASKVTATAPTLFSEEDPSK